MAVVYVEKASTVKRPDPTTCPHASINRVLDSYLCNACGAEFRPVKAKNVTKW